MSMRLIETPLGRRFAKAVLGQGNLPINIKIRRAARAVRSKRRLSSEDLVGDFAGWYYHMELDKKFDETKGSLDSYLVQQAWCYLTREVRRFRREEERKKQIAEVMYGTASGIEEYEQDNSAITDKVTAAQYAEGMKWISSGGSEDIGSTFERKELLDNILEGIRSSGYKDTYFDIMFGLMSAREAEEELDLGKSQIYENVERIAAHLREHLLSLGYSQRDAERILSR